MENNSSRVMMRTNRGFWKTLLLGIVTLGIYPLVVYTNCVNDLNTLAAHDGKKTMHFLLLTFIIAPITLGIAICHLCLAC